MRISVSILILIPLLSGCDLTPHEEADRVDKPAIHKMAEAEEDHPANPALRNLILVRAKVKSIDSVTLNKSNATLEIVHVYCGPAKLMGRSFRDVQMFENMGGSPARARFELGEEGVWSIQADNDKLRPTVYDRLPFLYRSRKADNPGHAYVVALADRVETYAKAKPEDRPALAEKFVQDDTVFVSYWMVGTLPDTDEKFAADLLAKLRENPGDLPHLGQIALDKVLCAKEQEDWYSTPMRAELLKSWVSGKLPSQAGSILSRLDSAVQEGALREDRLLELVRIAALNKDWSKENRRDAIRLLARRKKVDPQPTYDWLFDQIRTHPDADLRKVATQVLGSLGFDAKLIQAVEDYLETEEKDPEVLKVLQKALKEEKDREKK